MTSPNWITQAQQAMRALTDAELTTNVTLTNCDREPIHIPNAIQPHGVLLTCTEADLTIVQISQNCSQLLGQSPQDLLGNPLSVLFPAAKIAEIQRCLAPDDEQVNPIEFLLTVDECPRRFGGILHQIDAVIVLEIELLPDDYSIDFFDFYRLVKQPITHLQNTQTLEELCQVAVTQVRRITGFDRVMVYRFDAEGAGDVIAEAQDGRRVSYLGLHYPATDVPQQAKQLYRLNPLRIIPDAVYEPVHLEPADNPVTEAPLDLSLSVLRSVSPMHTEYLANMGVRASMSISLLRNQRLWGLIACHHDTPKFIPYDLRTVCEFLGQAISVELSAKLAMAERDAQIQRLDRQAHVIQGMVPYQTVAEAVLHNPDALMALAEASGFIFCEGDQITSFGQTPPEALLPVLLDWVQTAFEPQAVLYCTDALGQVNPEMEPYRHMAAGLLALRIARTPAIYLVWLRPEIVQTVNWAGDPQQKEETDAEGLPYLSPRQSFARWQETVRLRSHPWSQQLQASLLALHSALLEIVLNKADELAKVNATLEHSLKELDTFAYTVSHDLKAPLRGISNLSEWLLDDLGGQLPAENQEQLQLIQQRVQRMEELINGILQYSRVGRQPLASEVVDIKTLILEVMDALDVPPTFEVKLSPDLPALEAQALLLKQVFSNLISNAVKYHDRSAGTITVSWQQQGNQIKFTVADDGPGIDPLHHQRIFGIFQTLTTADKAKGTGVGLSIVRKIIEQQGGRVWVESVLGQGSAFSFTWPVQVNGDS